MRILLAGDGHSTVHERPLARALQNLGHEVIEFSWRPFFFPEGGSPGLLSRAQHRLLLGPKLDAANRALVQEAERVSPDVVFVYRGTPIRRRTLRQVRSVAAGAVLIGYSNDDPFSPQAPRWLWRHYVRAIPEYDLVAGYRAGNIADLEAAGARRAEVLRSWFVPWVHRPMTLSGPECDRYGCDVVFVGHAENDGRLEALEALAQAGLKVRLFGHYDGRGEYGWKGALSRSRVLGHLAPTEQVWGEDYVRAICGARIALCFLSKLNRDTYTRRCFEIPACGTMMLAERTDELASLFAEGREASFFSDLGELVDKASAYVLDEARRSRVALGGQRRVWVDRHSVDDRAAEIIAWAQECRAGQPDSHS